MVVHCDIMMELYQNQEVCVRFPHKIFPCEVSF